MIDYPSLTGLDDTAVAEELTMLVERVQEFAPTQDTKRGPVRDIVLELESALAAASASVINTQVGLSGSLLAITEDPAAADDAMVDELLSNFQVTRVAGASAQGEVTIVLSSLTPVVIPRGAVFTSGGLEFTSDAAYSARVSESSVTSPTDRLLEAISGGQYAFTISVTAVEIGLAGQLAKDASLTPDFTISAFVRAYVSADFTGGIDEETNQEMIDRRRLQDGMAAKSPGNRADMTAMLKAEFSSITAVSDVGAGDAEQLRYHSIFPVSFGGRDDVYVRTRPYPQSLDLTVTASLIEKVADRGIWQFSLSRTDAPGAYRVQDIVISGETGDGYTIQSATRGLDVTADGSEFIPDVLTADEAAFSRFQTLMVRFLDSDTDVTAMSLGHEQDYDIVALGLPDIVAVQSFAGARDRRSTDVLIRGAVPALTAVSFTIFKASSEDTPDTDAIATALADYVNGLGFVGSLAASALAHQVQSSLSSTQTLGDISMTAEILCPDDSTQSLSSTTALSIPSTPEIMLSSKTALFFLSPDDVTITVENRDP